MLEHRSGPPPAPTLQCIMQCILAGFAHTLLVVVVHSAVSLLLQTMRRRLQGALKIQETLEKHLGIHIGETTKVRPPPPHTHTHTH